MSRISQPLIPAFTTAFQETISRSEAPPIKWSEVNLSFLTDFPKKEWWIGHEQEAVFSVLKQAELGLPVVDLIRKVGITEQNFYRWKKQYSGMESVQIRELKQLSEENSRLKKLVADPSLDKAVL